MRYYVLECEQAQVAMLVEHRGSLLKLLKNAFIPEHNKINFEYERPCIDCLFGNAEIFLDDGVGCFLAQTRFEEIIGEKFPSPLLDNL